MLLAIIFPQITDFLQNSLDIPNAIVRLSILFDFCMLLILMSITSIVTKLTQKMKTLAQVLSICEKRIRELEKSNEITKQ